MLARTFVLGFWQGAVLLMALFSLAGAAEAQKETPAPEVAPADVLKYFAGDWKGTGEVVGFAEWSFTAKTEQEVNGNCILERRHLTEDEELAQRHGRTGPIPQRRVQGSAEMDEAG